MSPAPEVVLLILLPSALAALAAAALLLYRGLRRSRRPRLLRGGAALLLVAGALAGLSTPSLLRVDWYRHKPTGYIHDDLELNAPATSQRAWAELRRRFARSSTLSDAHRHRLAAHALAWQERGSQGPVARELVEWLGRSALDGTLSPPHRERFFRNAVLLRLRARPRVVAGEPIPYDVYYRTALPPGQWWTRIRPLALKLDNIEVSTDTGGATNAPPRWPGFSGAAGAGSTLSHIPAPDAAPGWHTLALTAHVTYLHGDTAREADARPPDDPAAKPLHERTVTVTADTEILPDPEAAGFRLVDNPALAETLRARLVPHNFRRERSTDTDRTSDADRNPEGRADPAHTLAGEIEARRLPSGVSFDVFARAAGREYFAGNITVNRNRFTRHRLRAHPFPAAPSETVDLVFRTNEKAARLTVDVEEVWNGELVVPGVPVKDGS